MKPRNLFIVQAVCSLFFGSSLVLAPALLMSLYGETLSQAGTYIARLLGAVILGICILAWFTRNAPNSEARRAIVLVLFAAQSIGFFVSLLGQLSSVNNALDCSTVAIYLSLALGSGYFQLRRQS